MRKSSPGWVATRLQEIAAQLLPAYQALERLRLTS